MRIFFPEENSVTEGTKSSVTETQSKPAKAQNSFELETKLKEVEFELKKCQQSLRDTERRLQDAKRNNVNIFETEVKNVRLIGSDSDGDRTEWCAKMFLHESGHTFFVLTEDDEECDLLNEAVEILEGEEEIKIQGEAIVFSPNLARRYVVEYVSGYDDGIWQRCY